MQQFIFNIENIKILFLLATGIFSWSIFEKYKKNQQKHNTKQHLGYFSEWINTLNKHKFQNMNSKERYQCFTQRNDKSEPDNEVNSQNIKELTYHNNHQINADKQSPKSPNKQHQNLEQQIDSIMSKYLVTHIQKSKSVYQLLQQHQKKYGNLQENQPAIIQEENHIKGRIVHSLRQNIVKMEDSIVYVQVSTKDQNDQFFKPVIESTVMESEQKQQNSFQQQQLLTNQQRLILTKRVHQKPQQQNQILKHKKIRKYKSQKQKKTIPHPTQPQTSTQPQSITKNPQQTKKPLMQININLYSNNPLLSPPIPTTTTTTNIKQYQYYCQTNNNLSLNQISLTMNSQLPTSKPPDDSITITTQQLQKLHMQPPPLP